MLPNSSYQEALAQRMAQPQQLTHPRKGSRLLRRSTFSLVRRMNSCTQRLTGGQLHRVASCRAPAAAPDMPAALAGGRGFPGVAPQSSCGQPAGVHASSGCKRRGPLWLAASTVPHSTCSAVLAAPQVRTLPHLDPCAKARERWVGGRGLLEAMLCLPIKHPHLLASSYTASVQEGPCGPLLLRSPCLCPPPPCWSEPAHGALQKFA